MSLAAECAVILQPKWNSCGRKTEEKKMSSSISRNDTESSTFPFNESTFSLSQIPTVQSRFEAVRLHKREIQGCDCQRSLMRPQELGVKHGKSSDSVAMVFEKWPAG